MSGEGSIEPCSERSPCFSDHCSIVRIGFVVLRQVLMSIGSCLMVC